MEKKDALIQRGSTIFLRVTVIALGLLVLTFCAFLLPSIHQEWAGEFPKIAYLKYPVLIGLVIAATAFFIALFHTLKLLNYIDKNKAFSQSSVQALKTIRYCASVVAVFCAATMPLVYLKADKDDSPGLIVVSMAFFVGAPIVVAVFAMVAERLLQNAIDIKSENDLTV